MFHYTVEIEREDDGRWIAEAPQLPGALVYGDTEEEAVARVALMIREKFRLDLGIDAAALVRLTFVRCN